MDIVLELFDTLGFDYFYSAILPAGPVPYYLSGNGTGNAILPRSAVSTWQYKPATQFFSITPHEAAYSSAWNRDNPYRQGLSLFLITWIFGLVVYFIFASLSYIFVFDKSNFKHPKFLKDQVKMEIAQASAALPGMAIFTAPIFLAEVRGYSKLYDLTSEGPGTWYNWVQIPFFLIFTDFWIYLIHRGLHHPRVYKTLHKPHHKWIMPTPYASHAFHPLDGFAQSVPYHLFPFLFPLQKFLYVGLFVFINIWTIIIHDGEYVTNSPIINGAACHTMHHLYSNYNYGQYTTLWDRLGGSYRKPNEELFRRETKTGKKEWERQVKEVERVVKEVEGSDDRIYAQSDETSVRIKKDL